MSRPLVCLSLTCKTLEENVEIVRKYHSYIDLVELRVDFLNEDECLYVRNFPSMVKIPCILTIRRKIDGGEYVAGESSRTMLFARAMAFADQNKENNFQYVDFEEDFHVPSLQEGALAFGTRIIRSCHEMSNNVVDIIGKYDEMRKTGFEIPKIAFMPKNLSDVTRAFNELENFTRYDHILCVMGPLGTPSRILSYKTHSFLTYTSPLETLQNLQNIGHIDPIELSDVYNFRELNENTKIYGITGWPLEKTLSPRLHSVGYANHGMNSVFIPVRSPNVHETLEFCEEVGIQGLAVTVPYKEAVISELDDIDMEVGDIGSCNTVIRHDNKWLGYNTDAWGFTVAIKEFLGVKNLRHKRVSIIGAGGAAKAIAYAVRNLGAKACVFNRTISKARNLAEMYGFYYAPLNPESSSVLEKYSDLIIQTTSLGMGSNDASSEKNDPIYFYNFKGHEALYDIVYIPSETPVMKRASASGCLVSNGYSMLRHQGYKQFKIFTGVDYNAN